MIWIDELITSLHGGDENFALQDEGSIDKYLGVNVKQIDKTHLSFLNHFWLNVLLVFLVLLMARLSRGLLLLENLNWTKIYLVFLGSTNGSIKAQ